MEKQMEMRMEQGIALRIVVIILLSLQIIDRNIMVLLQQTSTQRHLFILWCLLLLIKISIKTCSLKKIKMIFQAKNSQLNKQQNLLFTHTNLTLITTTHISKIKLKYILLWVGKIQLAIVLCLGNKRSKKTKIKINNYSLL